jgi:hypothetical protein
MNRCFLFIIFSLLFTACSKNKDDNKVERYVRFTYNGQQYEANWPGSYVSTQFILPEFIFANFSGLYISRPDIFNGDIVVMASQANGLQCAYLRPTGTNVTGMCNSLIDNGNPIDPLRTFWLESGTIGFNYSQCENLTNVTVQGQQLCTVTGTFSFTLTNKNNQKIIITNGSFRDQIKKYR